MGHIEESGKGNTRTSPRESYGEDNLHEPYGRSGGRYPQYAGPGDFRVEDREQYGSRDEQEAMNLPKFPFDLGPRDAVRDPQPIRWELTKHWSRLFSKKKKI